MLRNLCSSGANGEVVWLSTHGNIMWDAPSEDLITVEEALGQVQPLEHGQCSI